MSLLHTSSTLRRLFLGPGPLYRPCVSANRLVEGFSHCQTTKTRPPWAHQARFSSSDLQGNGQDDDPYKILGIPKDAPQSEIKKAYYAQAKKLHPDASKRKNTEGFHKVSGPHTRPSPSCCQGISRDNKPTFVTASSRLRQDLKSSSKEEAR